uniref:Endonuclease/exonuclease/phosphatase domain-containing protein n=1 Tax=Leptobrachium leishanense TaxID=445787 RepID=A0A8C5Q9K7_9ANUR
MYTFANIYAPNKSQHKFLAKFLTTLNDFTEGCLVLGGDINLPLDPLRDTSSGRSAVPIHILRRIGSLLHSNRLVDCWRALHPDDKDYTFFSHPAQTYSRLDYFFLPHYHLQDLHSATIGNLTWSDHAPITMTLTSPLYRTAAPSWRLNDSLLADPTVIQDCTQALEHYFTENTNPDLSPLTIWEAHKCVVRGYNIQKAAEFKRQRSTAIAEALTRIAMLETLHKGSLDPDDLIELTTARRDFTTLLNSSYHGQCQRSKMFFFAHGDKSGRLLARMLQKRRAASYIAKIRDSHKNLHYLPGDIQSTIRSYYESLYNLPGLPPPAGIGQLSDNTPEMSVTTVDRATP